MQREESKGSAELIALVAVVGSLIAVVIELPQTQTSLRAQAYQARAFDGIEWNCQAAQNSEFRRINKRLASGFCSFHYTG